MQKLNRLGCFTLLAVLCTLCAAQAEEVQLPDGRRVKLADIHGLQPIEWGDERWVVETVRTDRYGRAEVYLRDAQGALLQERLVRQGAAMVYVTQPSEHAAALLAAEAELPMPIPHEDAGQHIGTIQRVRGVVADVAIRKYQTYLNFGADWKTDFTILVPKKVAKAMGEERLLALKGKEVTVRGLVHSYYGPRVTLFDPLMLEE